MIIYKQKYRTNYDDILFDKSQHYINDSMTAQITVCQAWYCILSSFWTS